MQLVVSTKVSKLARVRDWSDILFCFSQKRYNEKPARTPKI